MKWTDESIKSSILEFVKQYELNRMPSVSELRNNNKGDLAVAISKRGGFFAWAEKLNLSVKKSETELGKSFENLFREQVSQEVKLNSAQMPMKFPYDVLIEGCVKVDVKCGFLYKGKEGRYYTFNLEQENRKSDLLACYCLKEDKSVHKLYIIPSILLQGKKQLSIGEVKSIYDKYLNGYHLILKYLNFYNEIRKEAEQ